MVNQQHKQHKMKDKGIQHINTNNYCGDSINEHRAIESGNRQIAEKEIKQQNENL